MIQMPMLVVMLKVWDLSKAQPDDEPSLTKELRCDCSDLDIEIALRDYAEDDVDGLNEGIYDSGTEFLIQVDERPKETWKVYVDLVPDFTPMRAAPSDSHGTNP